MVKMDVRRAFGRWFCLAVVINFAQYYISELPFMSPPYNAVNLFETGLLFNYLNWMSALIVALPFATSFCADWKSRSALSQILRSGRSRYIRSKLIAAGLSGALVEAVGLFIFFLALLAGGTLDETRELYAHRGYFAKIIADAHWSYYVIGAIAIRSLAGAFGALSGLAFSSFVPNRYFALCFPLFLTRVSMEIQWSSASIPAWVNLLALSEGLIQRDFWSTIGIAVMVFGVGMALCFLSFTLGVRRRLEHG